MQPWKFEIVEALQLPLHFNCDDNDSKDFVTTRKMNII